MSHRKIIYSPSVRAGEYADKGVAVNVYQGCDHGCRYCYAAGMAERFHKVPRSVFHAGVVPVPDLFARLSDNVQDYFSEDIFMCFICDAYPATENVREITRECLKIIMKSQNYVNILTKGGLRAVQDFDLLAQNKRNKLGATLTFVDPDLSREWEPRAALPDDRLSMLSQAKDAGIYTWVSAEPVIVPAQTLRAVFLAAPYVDEIRIGKLNHMPDIEVNIDWRKFYLDAKAMVEELQKTWKFKVYYKRDLLAAAGVRK